MPSLSVVDMAKGAEAAATRDTAWDTAQTKLQQEQATLEQTQQQNKIRQHTVNDLNTLAGMTGASPTGGTMADMAAESPLGAEYSQMAKDAIMSGKKIGQAQEKLKLLDQKLASVVSPDIAEKLRLQRKDAEDEVKAAKEAHTASKIALIQKPAQEAFNAYDQASWDRSKQHLAEARKQAVLAASREQGVPDEQAMRAAQLEYDNTLKEAPAKFGNSSKYFVAQLMSEVTPMNDEFKVNEEIRRQEKHAADLAKAKADLEKLNKDMDDKSPENIGNALKDLKELANTQSNIINRDTPAELIIADENIKLAKEKQSSWFMSDAEKAQADAELLAAEKEKQNILARKEQAETILGKVQNKINLLMDMSEAKGLPLDSLEEKPEPTKLDPSQYSLSKEAQQDGLTPQALVAAIMQQTGMTEQEAYDAAVEQGDLIPPSANKKSKSILGRSFSTKHPTA